jgi:putative DNA primase/helicase
MPDDQPASAHDLLERRAGTAGREEQGQQSSGNPLEYDLQSTPSEIHLSEDGVAQAFAEKHAHHLRFCHGPNRWFLWDGTRWRQEKTRLAYHWCRTIARNLARGTKDEWQRASLGRAAFASGVERLAQSDRVFAVTPDIWDRDPWLLGTPGGVVDLRTGKLRAASPADYISKLTMVAPSERGVECPVWERFLDEITCGDLELRHFLWQFLGYTLTGDVREECLLFLFGLGRNGKGTLIRTVARVMGDYAVASDMTTFTASKTDRHPTELAKLAGARLVTATETEQGRTWAWSRIKELTGNERPISARFMRRDHFEFYPTAKLVFTGNHKPNLPSTDEATARRMRLVPFEFVARAPDNTLKMRLEAEAPAILRWLIEGCLDWQANGLHRAQCEIAATSEYLAEQDLFSQWVDTDCTTHVNDTATRAELFASWAAFAEANGEAAGTSRDFGQRMRAAGFLEIKNVPGRHGTRGYRGVGLKVSPNPPRE